MPLSPLEYLRHILDETEYLIFERQGLSKEQFLQNATLKRAFVRSVEIIGEASKKVPSDLSTCFHKYDDVRWLREILRRFAPQNDHACHSERSEESQCE